MEFVLRTIAILCGLGAVGRLAMLLTWLQHGGDPASLSDGVVAGVISIAVSGGLAWWLWRIPAKWARKAQAMKASAIDAKAQETVAYFDAVNEARAFPPAQADRVIDKPDRRVLAACNARLVEMTTKRVTTGGGTRIKLAGVPFYVGQSVGKSELVRKEPVGGELAATSRGLTFVGDGRNFELPYKTIDAVEIYEDGFQVASSKRANPVLFLVPNGMLWGHLVKNLVALGGVDGRNLPEGTMLRPM